METETDCWRCTNSGGATRALAQGHAGVVLIAHASQFQPLLSSSKNEPNMQKNSNSWRENHGTMKSHLALAHGHAGAVPVAHVSLGLLVVVVAARAEGCAKGVLVLCQPLDHDCRHRLVNAEVRARPAHTVKR